MLKWTARNDICCGSIDLAIGVWLIAAHSIIQGLYGVLIVFTSKYKPYGETEIVINLVCYLGCFFLIFLGSKYYLKFKHNKEMT